MRKVFLVVALVLAAGTLVSALRPQPWRPGVSLATAKRITSGMSSGEVRALTGRAPDVSSTVIYPAALYKRNCPQITGWVLRDVKPVPDEAAVSSVRWREDDGESALIVYYLDGWVLSVVYDDSSPSRLRQIWDRIQHFLRLG
jgi:hypothetical protein